MSDKFKFSAVVEYEIDEKEAVSLLADPFPNRGLDDWITSHHAVSERDSATINDQHRSQTHALGQIKEALGKHLANKKIAECKQLAEVNVES